MAATPCDHSSHIRGSISAAGFVCLNCDEILRPPGVWGSNDKENWSRIGRIVANQHAVSWRITSKAAWRYFYGNLPEIPVTSKEARL